MVETKRSICSFDPVPTIAGVAPARPSSQVSYLAINLLLFNNSKGNILKNIFS
jgi:hypothetical protein